MIEGRLLESEFKYNQLMHDFTTNHKEIRTQIGSKSPCINKIQDQIALDFQRKISSNLEQEKKILQEDVEFLRLKLTEYENNNSEQPFESNLISNLMSELEVYSQKELYKKILYLQECFNQAKEQRQLIQRLATLISQKICKPQISCKEVWSYIIKNLP